MHVQHARDKLFAMSLLSFALLAVTVPDLEKAPKAALERTQIAIPAEVGYPSAVAMDDALSLPETPIRNTTSGWSGRGAPASER